MTDREIEVEGFSGPLDLLLRLVDREELDITRLSLSQVADDFLREMELRKIELAELAEFLFIASQLILIKSKALLPLFQFTPEEEAEIGDLEERLKEYRSFKKASLILQEKMAKKKVFFAREKTGKEEIENQFVSPDLSLEKLKEYYQSVLEKNSPQEELEERVLEEIVTLEEKIFHLKSSLEGRMKMAFQESIQEAKNKIEVVVTFLAMLEMVKRKVIFVSQEQNFGEIILERNKRLSNLKGRQDEK